MTVLVLDDDPTGTQCAAGVPVLLHPEDMAPFPADAGPAYVLTNTRARSRTGAVRLVGYIRERVGPTADLVLRGDSTLRGHVFPEMRALGLDRGVGLFVPAYPAAGRVTVDGVHYLTTSGERVNVADTEFARDPVFGFTARTLRDWVAEVGYLRPRAIGGGPRPVASVGRGRSVVDALLSLSDGGVVIPDVVDDADLVPIVDGLRVARAAGRHVVVRCAAPLAALIAGVPGRIVPPPDEPARRLLVVCGSHTAAATQQLGALPFPYLVLPTDAMVGGGRERAARDEAVRLVAAAARRHLDDTGVAVVATERVRRPEHGRLADGGAVMAGLTAVVRALAPQVDAIVAKGGITSADVATAGLGGTVALVAGQIETGVPLWTVAGMPLAVVPGNIGDAGTLVRMVRYFTGR